MPYHTHDPGWLNGRGFEVMGFFRSFVGVIVLGAVLGACVVAPAPYPARTYYHPYHPCYRCAYY